MTTPTYTPLANIALASAASSVVFSSIPSIYKDLVLVLVGYGSTSLQARIRFNGDTGNNYNYQQLTNTSSRATNQNSGFLSLGNNATPTQALQLTIDIMDYTNTDKHTVLVSRSTGAGFGEVFGNRYANTAAVNSITILTSTGNWAIGTTAAIYGIEA